jgi:hypothetical protein
LGSSLISAYVNKGEKFPIPPKIARYAFIWVRLHLFRGSCIWAIFARCVEPLPLLEGLAFFWLFELC